MNNELIELVNKYFPDCPTGQIRSFLMSATCYPLGSYADVENNLKKAVEAGCKTYQEAEAYCEEQIRLEMAKYN